MLVPKLLGNVPKGGRVCVILYVAVFLTPHPPFSRRAGLGTTARARRAAGGAARLPPELHAAARGAGARFIYVYIYIYIYILYRYIYKYIYTHIFKYHIYIYTHIYIYSVLCHDESRLLVLIRYYLGMQFHIDFQRLSRVHADPSPLPSCAMIIIAFVSTLHISTSVLSCCVLSTCMNFLNVKFTVILYSEMWQQAEF